MTTLARTSTRLSLSAVLSLSASILLTLALRRILTAALGKPEDTGAAASDGGPGPRPPRGRAPHINPVNVVVIAPVFIGNSPIFKPRCSGFFGGLMRGKNKR
jgi:hypothetical protein